MFFTQKIHVKLRANLSKVKNAPQLSAFKLHSKRRGAHLSKVSQLSQAATRKNLGMLPHTFLCTTSSEPQASKHAESLKPWQGSSQASLCKPQASARFLTFSCALLAASLNEVLRNLICAASHKLKQSPSHTTAQQANPQAQMSPSWWNVLRRSVSFAGKSQNLSPMKLFFNSRTAEA